MFSYLSRPSPSRGRRTRRAPYCRVVVKLLLSFWTSLVLTGIAWAAQKADGADPDLCHGTLPVVLGDGVTRSTANYSLPTIKLTRSDGKRMSAKDVFDDGRPLIVNFVYTSCTTVCPVSSQVFMRARELLGAERDKINMVSISIDPEQDTPRKLDAYAKRFAAAGQWAHYTGTIGESLAVQHAFNAWAGDKMNHMPLTFIRARQGQAWIRLDGFASPEQLVAEYHRAVDPIAVASGH
jgi:protein SCO1